MGSYTGGRKGGREYSSGAFVEKINCIVFMIHKSL